MKQRTIKTDIGCLNLIEENEKLVGLEFVEGESSYCDDSTLLKHAEKQVQEYLQGKRKNFEIPIFFKGSSFQEQVWNALLRIPYGEVRSYQEVAQMIG
ncbi:MAG: MGMT family protein, partial [Erysipelotrichaceae bacterium]